MHDLGKVTTPNEILPHHYGHEERGIEQVTALARRIGIPKSWEKCGRAAAKWHMKAGIFNKMTAKKKVEFIENVDTNQKLVFIDKEGNTLTNEDTLGTGMILKVGETLQYTLVVTGDTDGDGSIEVNDLARVKLHLIDYKKLTGIELKAANIDNDDDITVNDAAQIKLVLIGLMEVK